MSRVAKDGVVFSSTTSGTGTFGIGSAVLPYRTPSSASLADGSTVDCIAYTATEYEAFRGTYSSAGATISRDTVYAQVGTIVGGKVNFGGNPTIAICPLAESFGAAAFSNLASDLSMPTLAWTPASNDGAALGTTILQWSDLFLASGGVLNWNNGDVTVTHSANALAFAGASSGYSFDALITPATDDGAPIGSTALKWSDLFLASGAVINFNNGNLTLTHSAGFLTMTGGFKADALYDNTYRVAGSVVASGTVTGAPSVLDFHFDGLPFKRYRISLTKVRTNTSGSAGYGYLSMQFGTGSAHTIDSGKHFNTPYWDYWVVWLRTHGFVGTNIATNMSADGSASSIYAGTPIYSASGIEPPDVEIIMDDVGNNSGSQAVSGHVVGKGESGFTNMGGGFVGISTPVTALRFFNDAHALGNGIRYRVIGER